MTTIYKYTNRSNGKVYIGKTDRPINERHREHKHISKFGNTHWAHAVKKYGIESFTLEVLCSVPSEDGAFAEIAFIAILKSSDKTYGYNSTDGGEGVVGHKHTIETKNRIRQSVSGRRLGHFSRNPTYGRMNAMVVQKRLDSRWGPNYIPKYPSRRKYQT